MSGMSKSRLVPWAAVVQATRTHRHRIGQVKIWSRHQVFRHIVWELQIASPMVSVASTAIRAGDGHHKMAQLVSPELVNISSFAHEP